MNLVMEECVESDIKKGTNVPIGRIMLKGDNISLVRPVENISQ
jgi:small nuclear ribonucleoprotein (snRNP)-like protein